MDNKRLLFKKEYEYRMKYSKNIAFRKRKHLSIIAKHLNEDEEVLIAFCAQKNKSSFRLINSCSVALTDKRIVIGQKRLLWGYFFTSITPDMYNDLKVRKNLIWSDLEIDTIKENIYLSNIDPDGAILIETQITSYMMEAKKNYD